MRDNRLSPFSIARIPLSSLYRLLPPDASPVVFPSNVTLPIEKWSLPASGDFGDGRGLPSRLMNGLSHSSCPIPNFFSKKQFLSSVPSSPLSSLSNPFM